MLCKHQEENCARCALDDIKVPPIQVYFILDTSGSMASTWDQTLEGINEYFTSLRLKSENDYKVTLITFDVAVRKLYDGVVPDGLPKFTRSNLNANGESTSLYEAIGKTVKDIETDDPVLVVVFTDGQDNSSKTWDSEKVEKLTKEKEKEGNFTFVYLGVDKAAWNQEKSLGIRTANSANFTGNNKLEAFQTLTASSGAYASSMTKNYKSAISRGISAKGAKAVCNTSNFFNKADVAETDLPENQADGTGKVDK